MSQDRDSLGTRKLHLLRGEITYDFAKEQDANILHQLGYRDQKIRYFTYLYRHRPQIESIVAHHLNLPSAETCHSVDVEDWIHGSFNVCIRVDVDGQGKDPGKQVMIRFPLPYRIGENCNPGNADEKVRVEAGTYAWLQENCPTVPIPKLYGFGLSTGQSFTILDNMPFMIRIFQRLRRKFLSWLNYPIHPTMSNISSKVKIGSFILDENGYLTLNNRPLTVDIQQLVNEHIPVDIPRNNTYSTVSAYITDILALHESRLRNQPNAVNNLEDGVYQASALMVMRSVWSCFFRHEFLRGPFVLNLTDLNQSNIFVDDDWNIKFLIDLEWACSHPVEMIQPPYWLTNEAIDLISLDDYKVLHQEFMDAFKEEELKMKLPVQLYPILQQGWDRGTFWCSLALSSPTALFKIFYDFIQPRFSKAHEDPAFWKITMPYWTFNAFQFLEHRVKDKEQYNISLREAFESGSCHD